MKIYVASSWRNALQPEVVAALRSAGHEVYDFRHPAPGNDGFRWLELTWMDSDLCHQHVPAELDEVLAEALAAAYTEGQRSAQEAQQTVASIAAMLGWMNVPPRHVLEADITALKSRLAAPPPHREGADAGLVLADDDAGLIAAAQAHVEQVVKDRGRTFNDIGEVLRLKSAFHAGAKWVEAPRQSGAEAQRASGERLPDTLAVTLREVLDKGAHETYCASASNRSDLAHLFGLPCNCVLGRLRTALRSDGERWLSWAEGPQSQEGA